MTTRLNRPVSRVVPTRYYGDVTVTITLDGVLYREKRRKTAYLIPHGVAFQRAVVLAIAAKKAEQKAKRAARRRV